MDPNVFPILEKTTPNGPKRSKTSKKRPNQGEDKIYFFWVGTKSMFFFDFSQRENAQAVRIEKYFIKIGGDGNSQRKNWT